MCKTALQTGYLASLHWLLVATLFWHLDETFPGSTRDIHQMISSPSPGNHKLLIIDELGNSSTRYFKVVE